MLLPITPITSTQPHDACVDTTDIGCQPGERFHMDLGFVRGTKFSYKDEDGNLVTSMDGYNSYLLIIDRATRYTWVFLAKSKAPQIDTIKSFLKYMAVKPVPKNSYAQMKEENSGGHMISKRQ